MPFFILLLLTIGCVTLGSDVAQVTIVDRCSTEMMMNGLMMGSGQSFTAELDADGFDLRNATDGRVLASLSLASSSQRNFLGSLNIAGGVRFGVRAEEPNFHNAFIQFEQGAFGSLGSDRFSNPFTCNRPTCIFNHLFPKAGNGLVVTFC